MTHRISYLDTSRVSAGKSGIEFRTESFASGPAAMARVRKLLDDVDCQSVAVCDDRGETVAGVRLQLKLGLTAE